MIEGVSNYQDIKQFILDIENKYPVDQWIYNDIHFWPHIRVQLYYALIHSLKKEDFKVVLEQHTEKTSISKLDGLKQLWKSYINYNRFFKSIAPKALLFMSLDMHKVKHEDVYFNRFFDSMISANELEKDSFTFEIKKSPLPCYNQASVEKVSPYLEFYYKKHKLLKAFNAIKNQQAHFVEGNDQLKQFLIISGFNKIAEQLMESKLDVWSTKIRVYANFYKQYLIKAKTKKVVLQSNTGFDFMYAAIFAARKIAIPTIEMQHGYQTDLHMGYCNWSKVPFNGFNILPLEYWCWDKYSKIGIEEWSKATNVKAKVYGNPWISNYLRHSSNSINNTTSTILYTLPLFEINELESIFPSGVLELLSLNDVRIKLRFHPRQTPNISGLKDFFKNKGTNYANFEFQNSRGVSLPNTLLTTDLHITNASACLLEAFQMNVSSIVIDEVGQSVYQDYFDNQLIFYVNKHEHSFKSQALEIMSFKNEIRYDVAQIENPLNF
jgi:hypothetical protein